MYPCRTFIRKDLLNITTQYFIDGRVIQLRTVGVSRLSRDNVEKSALDVPGEGALELDGFICPSDRCGRIFPEPVRLTDLSHRPQEETYYACPFCFSRLNVDGILGDSDHFGGKTHVGAEFAASASKGKASKKQSEEKMTAVLGCPHQFGYLRSRSKGSEIPDTCLTCPKILQCMAST